MKKVVGLLLLALFALMVGCQTPVVSSGPHSEVFGNHTLKSVEKSILTALYDLQWNARKVDSRDIEARLFAKAPGFNEIMLTVLISYTPNEFVVRYVDSVNMQYDAATNTIDHHYDLWINELIQRIKDELVRTQNQMFNPAAYNAELAVEKIVILESEKVVVVPVAK